MMAAMTFLALAYTLKEKSHIRMTFLHTIAKGRAKIMVDVFALCVGATFCAVLTYTTMDFFWDAVVTKSRSMSISQTYMAIPQFFYAVWNIGHDSAIRGGDYSFRVVAAVRQCG